MFWVRHPNEGAQEKGEKDKGRGGARRRGIVDRTDTAVDE